jgi:hypothetical protein
MMESPLHLGVLQELAKLLQRWAQLCLIPTPRAQVILLPSPVAETLNPKNSISLEILFLQSATLQYIVSSLR